MLLVDGWGAAADLLISYIHVALLSKSIMLIVDSIFKGITLNKKRRLDHELLKRPETCIFKLLGYVPNGSIN